MSKENPTSKDIDIQTKEGLELLKIKAKYYGHYAEALKVLDLIREIEMWHDYWEVENKGKS
jgi:hypothetical protein